MRGARLGGGPQTLPKIVLSGSIFAGSVGRNPITASERDDYGRFPRLRKQSVNVSQRRELTGLESACRLARQMEWRGLKPPFNKETTSETVFYGAYCGVCGDSRCDRPRQSRQHFRRGCHVPVSDLRKVG
ncbi:protein of unknown function [Hyphomicrobium sp. MC1]|nr:protein of unknown function [Hyphomicrobium sp. MC1]